MFTTFRLINKLPMTSLGSQLTMASSRDADELLELWQGWREVSPPMRPLYARLVELANQGASLDDRVCCSLRIERIRASSTRHRTEPVPGDSPNGRATHNQRCRCEV